MTLLINRENVFYLFFKDFLSNNTSLVAGNNGGTKHCPKLSVKMFFKV